MKWLLSQLECDSNVPFLLCFLEDFSRLRKISCSVLDFHNCCRMATKSEGSESHELKFRIFDGTDIGHGTYFSSITAATLKQKLLSEWPQDKSVVPKSERDMKLIHAGKVLENDKTLVDSGLHVGYLTGEVITMHVVVQPSVTKQKTGKNQAEKPDQHSCSCTIL